MTANKLVNLGYSYGLDVYEPCPAAPNASQCSPLFPDHLELAINDQFAPAAAFLGSAKVDLDPTHVTYVVDGARDRPTPGMVGDHAYWVSGLELRSSSHTSSNGDPEGQFDAVSHGFGAGDPPASGVVPGVGMLTGGNLGALTFASTTQTWGPTPAAPSSDSIAINAGNIATASIDVTRAHVDCNVALQITTDGPLTVTLPGRNRTVSAG